MKKSTKTFRLSDEARRLLVELSRRLGISQTAAMELAIREKAARDLRGERDYEALDEETTG